METKKAGYKEFTAVCFYEILGILQKENAYLPLQKTRMIEPAVDYISTHFNENISIPYLADLCKISQTYNFIFFNILFYALFTEPKSDILCFTASLIYSTFKFRVSR